VRLRTAVQKSKLWYLAVGLAAVDPEQRVHGVQRVRERAGARGVRVHVRQAAGRPPGQHVPVRERAAGERGCKKGSGSTTMPPASTCLGVRNEALQLTVLPPPTQLPASTTMAPSSVLHRPPRSSVLAHASVSRHA